MHRNAHNHSHNHSQDSQPRGRPVVPEESAKASDCFEQFLTASTLKTILGCYRNICEHLHLKPNALPLFYPKLKTHITSWKAKPLWKKFDTRANQKCYGRGKACPQTRVLIIGGGPCGLRTAIEAQLLGAKVVVVEKRDRMSRNNVLHLWPFVIDDLRALGAKKFFGKFCAGSIDHISIRQLQCILLKVALLLGVEVHTEVRFERILEPNPNEKTGWRAEFKPAEHPVSQFEFDVIIGADGKRNTLQGFKRKEFRGKLAIAITANFINKRTEAEARVEEISGVAFIFNQKFFKDLYAETGIDLENIVYYKDDTHYFVMTAKKQSLIDKGVIKEDLSDTAKLLAPDNVDREELMNYAREAAEFSTNYQMPDLEFAVNHYGHPDVAMFDFTSMYAAENASRVMERHNYKLLSILVGDSLLEPFWPTGSGCARGFLSSMDGAWAIRSWGSDTVTPLEVIAERESIYRLLAQTTPENLNKDYKSYTIEPWTRYPNLNKNLLLAHQVISLYDTDDLKSIELNPRSTPAIVEVPKKRRRESHVDPDTLLSWIKEQIREHEDLEVTNLTTSFRDGRVLCAIISHYRPDLLDYSAINAHDIARNNQVAFDLLEKELGIPPFLSGEEMADNESPDFLTMLGYLTKVYDTFRCEIPHIKYPKYDMPEVKRNDNVFKIRTNVDRTDIFAAPAAPPARPSSRHKRHVDTSFLNKPSAGLTQDRKARKRRTLEKVGASVEDRQKRLEEIASNRSDRQSKRRQQRKMQTEQFLKSMQMLQSNCKPDHSEPFEDYSIYLYRQTAPNFEDRVKNLEKQFIYVPDKDTRAAPTQLKRETDEDFAARIKDLEEKWREPVSVEKKPKDLLRAIGKIETSDWNIKEIEKKIIENKLGKSVNKDKEKVPKWSREQFLARQNKMERKHLDRQDSAEVKFAEIDKNIKQLEQKLKEGSVRNLNQHKVASITEKLVGKTGEPTTTPQPPPPPLPKQVQKSNSRTVIAINQGSEFCHFCSKRVYLVERLTAEGKIFHTGCFRCQYCNTSLRLGTYMFDREGLYGHRFYCAQHFGMPGEISRPEKKPMQVQEDGPQKNLVTNVFGVDLLDRVQTPERIEFSNLSTGHVSSDHDESPSPIDEDEWTDRNNINSVIDSDSSDDSSSASDTDTDDEAYEEALEEPITKEGTLRWAERYKKRYSHKDDDSNSDGYSSSDHFSYYENSSGDDDSDTATEGEEEIRARELRKQEVRVEPPIDAGTDTEVKRLSNYPFDPNDPNLVSDQNLCTVDMPDILNNTLKVSKSSDNMSSTNEQFNSAESELDDLHRNAEMQNLLLKGENQKEVNTKAGIPKSNALSKSSTTSSLSSNSSVKRNFVIPSKERRKSFGKEFVPVIEQEPLLVIKRTPSKINLPPEIGKPKVQIKTNVENAKKYFGEPRKPSTSKPPINKSKKSPLIKQASLPEQSTIKKTNVKEEERRQSAFNFEPEESDLKEIDNYIENLMKNENELLKPVQSKNDHDKEKASSSIEDLLKALEVETNVEEHEMVEVKPEEKIEDLLNWIEELDHKAEDTHITSSLKPDKYKNLENVLRKPREADNVIHKLSKDNISSFESHLLGKIQKPLDDESAFPGSFQLSKSKTDVYLNKPRSSVDLDAVKKVDIRKVLQKFENNENKEQEFKQPRRSIVVPKNIVKRNSFANFTFNRSFEKDDRIPSYDPHQNSIGAKDFKKKAEMFENKLKKFEELDKRSEHFNEGLRRSPSFRRKFGQSKSNSQSPQRMYDSGLRSPPFLKDWRKAKAGSESPHRSSIGVSIRDDSSPRSPFLRKFQESVPKSQVPQIDAIKTTVDIENPTGSPLFLRKFEEFSSNLNKLSQKALVSDQNLHENQDSNDQISSVISQIQGNTGNVADELQLQQLPTDGAIVNDKFSQNLQPETIDGNSNLSGTGLLQQSTTDGVTIKDLPEAASNRVSSSPCKTLVTSKKSNEPSKENVQDDKMQLEPFSTNTEVGKDITSTIDDSKHFEEEFKRDNNQNVEIKDDGPNFDDITLDNDVPSQIQENYFQALVTVKNIIKNLNMQQIDQPDPNVEEHDIAASSQDENTLQNIVVESIPGEINDKSDKLQLENVINLCDKTQIELTDKKDNVMEEIDTSGQNASAGILRRDKLVEDTENLAKDSPESPLNHVQDIKEERISTEQETGTVQKRNLNSSLVEMHPLIEQDENIVEEPQNKETDSSSLGIKGNSNVVEDIPSIKPIITQETLPPGPPVVPQRAKRDHNFSMIPRLTRQSSPDNKINQSVPASNITRPLQSMRAASASPGVSRKLDPSFIPVPPLRKKSTLSTVPPNLNEGGTGDTSNSSKLNERSTSADNLQARKQSKYNTLKERMTLKNKEKECVIQ